MIVQPSFREAVQTFFRRKFTFLLVFGGVCLAGAAYLLLATPLYLSTTSLVVRFDQHTTPNIDRTEQTTQQLGSNERREILHSDAAILRSPDIARRVIDQIGLARLYPKIASSEKSPAHQMDEAVQAFSTDEVVDVGLQSDVINVSFLNRNPALAHQTVATLLNEFYGQEAVIYANPELKFSKAEAENAKKRLNQVQQELSDFRAQHKISDLSAQIGQLLQQRTDVESRLTVAQSTVAAAKQKQKMLTSLLKEVPPLVRTTAQGETYRGVDTIQGQLDTLEAKRQQMAATYRPGSSVFRSLDAEIGSLKSAARKERAQASKRDSTQPNLVYQNIQTDLLRASAEATSAQQPVDMLSRQLKQINDQLAELNGVRGRYDDLQRAVRIQDDTYRTLAIRYQESNVEASRNAQKISAAAVIAAPSMPVKPARPRRKLVALGTVLAGFLLACGCVLVIEAIDDRLRSPHDVAQILRLPVLATFGNDA